MAERYISSSALFSGLRGRCCTQNDRGCSSFQMRRRNRSVHTLSGELPPATETNFDPVFCMLGTEDGACVATVTWGNIAAIDTRVYLASGNDETQRPDSE